MVFLDYMKSVKTNPANQFSNNHIRPLGVKYLIDRWYDTSSSCGYITPAYSSQFWMADAEKFLFRIFLRMVGEFLAFTLIGGRAGHCWDFECYCLLISEFYDIVAQHEGNIFPDFLAWYIFQSPFSHSK